MGSIFSLSLPSMRSAYASHLDVTVEVEDFAYDQGDEVFISGTVDGGDDGDEVKITISPPTGSSTNDEVELNNEAYEYIYELSNNAREGLYTVKITAGDTVYSYFTVDDDDDDNNQVTVFVDEDMYSAGDEVRIEGMIEDVNDEENQYEITILGPDNDDIENSDDEELDNDEFSFDLELDNDAEHGRYAVIVDYDGDNGYAVFEVEDEDSGNGSGDAIEIETDKSRYDAGDTVLITGTVEDVDDDTIAIEVRDADNRRIADDDVDVENNGDFEFEFDLDDDAVEGRYVVTASYGNDDVTANFTVGATSGGSSGLTVKLNKTSYLAGEEMTVTGKVPRIIRETLVNIDVFRSNGTFVGSTSAEPGSDLTYTGTLRLKSSLAVEEGYRVQVSYGDQETSTTFKITGQSTTGSLSVKTDKPQYDSGTKITITGSVGEVVEGKSLLIQVFNPDSEAYRFDPVSPNSDGSYTYSMVVGGNLGIPGEYEVIATYDEKQVKTSFELVQAGKVTYNLRVNNGSFPIDYEAEGATVKSMFVKADEKKLVISTEANDDATIEIVLPREVINSVNNGSDTNYIVTAIDLETGSNEIIDTREISTTADARTLLVEVPEGTDLVEIQGTVVVPEFGQIAAIVMALSLTGVIVAAKRLRTGLKW